MKRRVLTVAGVLLALCLGAGIILLLHPPCLILKHTGFYCAGCGVQHMVQSLLRGDVPGAARQNVFMLVFLPVFCVYIVAEAVGYLRGRRQLYRSRAFVPVVCGVLAVAVLFTILRNLPGFQWLAPAWAVG